MNYKLKAACSCSIGRIRKNNEDNLYFHGLILPEENYGLEKTLYAEYMISKRQCIFGVFDGMGGEADGQIASYLAAGILQREYERMKFSPLSVQKNFEDLINSMNEAVYKNAESRFNRMGCTAAMLCFADERVYICNIGDSRIYRLHRHEMTQISEDHTDAGFLMSQGITKRKPHLTQCIGISPEEMQIQPYVAYEKICANDRYLICSDGLTDMVVLGDIQRILQETEDLTECTELLIKKALKGGGRDNVTVIVVQVENVNLQEHTALRDEIFFEKSKNDSSDIQCSYFIRDQCKKDTSMQITEEFRRALIENGFFEEEESKTVEILENRKVAGTVRTISSDNQKNRTKHNNTWIYVLGIVFIIMGLFKVGKPLITAMFLSEEEQNNTVIEETLEIEEELQDESQDIINIPPKYNLREELK